MGIRGLTSYIARYSQHYLQDHKLQDCYLVIDGNSLAAQLYISKSNSNCAFGGDYNRYTTLVKNFFLLLEKCNVKPLVLFDGGYHHRKLKTAQLRLREKILRAKYVTPVTQNRMKFFPSLLRHVFKDVLCELNVPFAQCLFEADEEIAAVSRLLGCPVLSYDSDFYVYDVLYIPFPTLCMTLCNDEECAASSYSTYLSCSLYKVQNFLNQFGGLKKEMLPLLATLLGNDYIRRQVFSDFVCNLKRPKSRKMSDTQRNIAGLLEWLRRETLESATNKVINRLDKKKREIVLEQVQRIVSLYTHCSSGILPVLGLDNLPAPGTYINAALKVEDESENYRDPDEREDTLVHNRQNDEVKCETQKVIAVESDYEQYTGITYSGVPVRTDEYDTSWLPHWFLLNFQQGAIPPIFMDMLMLQSYYLPPQVEDYNYPSSHTISVPIIGVIYGLLITSQSKNVLKLACYFRSNVSYQKIMVNPIFGTQSIKFPPLNALPNIPLSDSLKLLLEVANLNLHDQDKMICLPQPWQLYLLSVVYWARNSNQLVINSCHILAVIICLLVLDIVDSKIKFCGSRKQIKKIGVLKKCKNVDEKSKILRQLGKKYSDTSCDNCHATNACSVGSHVVDVSVTLGDGNNDNSEQIVELPDISNSGNSVCFENVPVHHKTDTEVKEANRGVQDVETFLELTLNDKLEQVTIEECLLARDVVYQYRNVEEKMKCAPKLFCVTIVHTFAQLQSSMLHFSYLNSLLGHPLHNLSPANFFSGTFLYNMYSNLRGRTDALAYISQLFVASPSIVKLITEMYSILGALLPNLPCAGHKKRKSRRKKHKHPASNSENNEKNESSEEEFEDSCNRFSALSLANDV